MYGETFMSEFDPGAVADRLATHHNVDVQALRKTDEQKQAEADMQAQANMMDKATGPVAGAVAKGVADQMNDN